MTKEKWQELHRELNDLHSDFLINYALYNNGSNKTKRETGKRKYKSALQLSVNYINNTPELIRLFIKTFNSPYDQGEFKEPRYFGRDMSKFLDKIKDIFS